MSTIWPKSRVENRSFQTLCADESNQPSEPSRDFLKSLGLTYSISIRFGPKVHVIFSRNLEIMGILLSRIAISPDDEPLVGDLIVQALLVRFLEELYEDLKAISLAEGRPMDAA